MKRLLAIACLLIALGAGGYFAWTKSPPYAVLQASSAIKKHELTEFHYWVDTRQVADSAITSLLAEPVQTVGAGLLERIIGISIVAVLRPVAVEAMTMQIDNWVVKGGRPKSSSWQFMPAAIAASDTDDEEVTEEEAPKGLFGKLVSLVKPPSLRQIFKEYGLTKKNYRGLGAVTIDGHTAHVGLRFFGEKSQKEFQIVLELTDAPGHWQVIRVQNLQEVVRTVIGV